MDRKDLTIIIRCALQSFENKKVICPPDWTVLRLKQHLRDICDSNPAPENQRLICSGRCLQDDEKRLSDCMAPLSDGVENYTIHLVYTPTVEQLRAQRKAEVEKKQKTQTETELRQRRTVEAPPTNRIPLPTEPVQPISDIRAAQGSYAAAGSHDWALAYQQMYTAHMANYMNYMQQVYGMPASVASQPINLNLPLNGAQVQQPIIPEAAQAPPPAPDPNAPAAGPAPNAEVPQIMNVGLGANPAQLPNDGNRDFLELVYMSFRLGLLIMLLYHYSSFEKCLFMVIAIAAIYGLNQGWFGLRGGGEEPAMHDLPQQEQNPENPEAEAAEDGNENTDNEIAEEEEPSAWEVFWSTCYIFITSFFASMVPERAPPMNAN